MRLTHKTLMDFAGTRGRGRGAPAAAGRAHACSARSLHSHISRHAPARASRRRSLRGGTIDVVVRIVMVGRSDGGCTSRLTAV
eukprot:COSAG02_NODE_114_length_35585_cov_149.458293_15_plen_83_part_00